MSKPTPKVWFTFNTRPKLFDTLIYVWNPFAIEGLWKLPSIPLLSLANDLKHWPFHGCSSWSIILCSWWSDVRPYNSLMAYSRVWTSHLLMLVQIVMMIPYLANSVKQSRMVAALSFASMAHPISLGIMSFVSLPAASSFFGWRHVPQNTNVIELYSRIIKDGTQITYYNSGIGTYARPSWRSYTYLKQVLNNKIDLMIAWYQPSLNYTVS